ncbi:MAG: excinuclease ABC subunit UvrC [Myxococcota bacterium]|nr:excinuclease ABC subunit UvrC [Myxococcota bacterium]
MWDKLKDRLGHFPKSPGVYLMYGAAEKIIYIGKAKNLHARLRQYFTGADKRNFVKQLDKVLTNIEVILTDNEKEALILENELIKKHKPRYNVLLKDDKRYLSLRLDERHTYPRVEFVRRAAHDGARYFGPFHSAYALRQTLQVINRHFQLRTCSDQVLRTRKRPCLLYDIKRCPAPCVYDLEDGSYTKNVADARAFLEGRGEELVAELKTKMLAKAEVMEFEVAALLRDQIVAIEKSLIKQKVARHGSTSRDVIGVYREGSAVEIHVMRTREGRLIDAQRFSLDSCEDAFDEILCGFALHYYDNVYDLPQEILFPVNMPWLDALLEHFREKFSQKVSLHTPRRGEKKKLIDLASRNAKQAFKDKARHSLENGRALDALSRRLRLKVRPERIECFDISHHQGDAIVGSCVRFVDGEPYKAGYRRYKVRSTTQQDDFKSMYEVLSRRLRRGLEEGDLPDLMVIDGGKGQLRSAMLALEEHGLEHLEILSLAKARGGELGTLESKNIKSMERIFRPNRKNPIVLRQNSKELFLLVRLRDEAHRFAITYHRKKSAKRLRASKLDQVPGIGPTRKRSLLRAFGSLKRIEQASLNALSDVVGAKCAQNIVDTLCEDAK